MNELTRLEESVTAETGAGASLVTLVTGFAAYVRAHATDPAKLTAFADTLDASKQKYLDAVAANPLPGEVITPITATGGKRR